MQVSPDSVASSWRSTSRSYFYLCTATLVCLVVAVAAILVLAVQKTDSTPSTADKVPLKGDSSVYHF